MLRSFVSLFLLLTLLSVSCRHYGNSQHNKRFVTTGFYHWKTKVALTDEDDSLLKNTGSKKLYVNFFDVVPNTDTAFRYPAVPGSKTEELSSLPKDMEIVPVVYITNDAVKNMDSADIPLMAEKITNKISRLGRWNSIKPAREIQIDCDWTHSTRDKYFYLLREIKRQSQIPVLSATIRLYQYKYYKKAGVPPVDRGVLMFYHMNAVRDMESKELILDVAEGKKYMVNNNYPLRLDYALPVFSELMMKTYYWQYSSKDKGTDMVFLYRHQNWLKDPHIRYGIKFFSPATFKKLMADSALRKIDTDENLYEAVKEIRLEDEYISKGTPFKMETVNPAELQKAATLLSAQANSDTFSIIFFHLDTDANSTYTTDEIKDIIHRFD